MKIKTFYDYINNMDSDQLLQKISTMTIIDKAKDFKSLPENVIKELILDHVLNKDYFEKLFSTYSHVLMVDLSKLLKEYDGEIISGFSWNNVLEKSNLGYICNYKIDYIPEHIDAEIDEITLKCADCPDYGKEEVCYECSKSELFDEDNGLDTLYHEEFCFFEDVLDILNSIDQNRVIELNNKFNDLNLCLCICIQIYGIITFKDLSLFYNRYFETPLSEKAIREMSYYFSCSLSFVTNQFAVINELALNDVNILNKLIEVSVNDEIYLPPIVNFYDNDPKYFLTEKTAFDNFSQWLQNKQNFDSARAESLLEFIQITFASDPSINSEKFPCRHFGIDIDSPESLDEFNQLMMEMFINTRLWFTRGFTPNEFYLKSNPVVESKTKISPNDRCPCGSGKKYKKCCGKIAD